MIALKKIFDVKRDILPFIDKYSRPIIPYQHDQSHNQHNVDQASHSQSHSQAQDSTTGQKGNSERIHIRIVGQEQDGSLLYTWDALSHASVTSQKESNIKVTHIGLYDPVKKTNEVLLVHEKLVDVVNCTVSQEHTFLGFVTHEQIYISEGIGRKQKQDVYHAYLAEVASPSLASRVFYLNLERSQIITLQFLYGQYQGHVTRRESHLLVLLHKESIGLYHIPVARVGNDGVIMSGEPKKDQIFERRFFWSQWDSQNQRLYVAHLQRQSKNTYSGGNAMGPNCLLNCYQFTEETVNELMVEVPFELPAPLGRTTGFKAHYLLHGPHQSTPDLAINMHLLMQNNGSLCLCVQHPYVSMKAAKARTGSSASRQNKDENVPVQYSVHIIHHGKTLKCFGMMLPRSVARKIRLLFTWLGDYVMVHAHRYFTHLLNVGIEIQPCHHILWHEEIQGKGSDSSELRPNDLMLPYISDRHGLSIAGASLYDMGGQAAYKMSLDQAKLLQVFSSTMNPTTRTAILHLATVHQRDLMFVKKIFGIVKYDVASAEVLSLIEEYLVGSTYSSMKRILDTPLYRYIPFTCAAMFNGQTEMAINGERLSSISYTSLSPVVMGKFAKQRATRGVYEPWTNLADFIKLESSHSQARFSCVEVQRQMTTKSDEEEAGFVKVKASDAPSILQRLTAIAKSALNPVMPVDQSSDSSAKGEARLTSRSEAVLGKMPVFLTNTPLTMNHAEERLVSLTMELLTVHLIKYLKSDTRTKIKNIASEYVTCQVQQSKQLIHLFCTIVLSNDVSGTSLQEAASKEEHSLFLLLERYRLATEQQAFPHPPGFALFFSCLAFRCLQYRVFLQYVEKKVIHVTREFTLKVIQDLPDSPENANIKQQLLQYLNPDDCLFCARKWRHPISRRFLALHYINACLTDGTKEMFDPLYDDGELQGVPQCDSSTSPGTGFPPLSTLINLMEKKSWKHGRSRKWRTEIDTRLVTQACLEQFYASGGCPDDILTFG